MRQCSACGSTANNLITVDLRISKFGGAEHHKHKIAQFYLCDGCERNNRRVMRRDRQQRERLAKLMTTIEERVYEDRQIVDLTSDQVEWLARY